MSNTFYGTLDSIPMNLYIQPGQAYPTDREGTLVEIDSLPSGASVDDIFYFNSPTTGKYLSRVIEGKVHAANIGLSSSNSGTVNSIRLNAAFAHAGITEVRFDFNHATDIPLSGDIDCKGKVVTFATSNRLTGTITLDNGIISAGYQSNILEHTITLTNFKTQQDKFSVKWYGAVGNGSTNDYLAIQKSLDTVIANQTKIITVYFPMGEYIINSPLIAYSWNGEDYDLFSINIEGESSFWPRSGTGSIIHANFRNTFALGIQRGKGVKVKNLAFTGLFTPPSPISDFEYYNINFDDYTDGLSRDCLNSPYSALVIDPFSTTTLQIPGDGGYPDLTSYYRGLGGRGGSTGIEITDITISGFVVGFICSPNGYTQNADVITISKIQFAFCKLCVSGTQDQEKANKISHAACWGPAHTFFATRKYGAQTPGNWIIDTVNIAGRTIRLVDCQQSGYFPIWIKHIYAESLGEFGITNGAVYVEESIIDFAYPNLVGAKILINSTATFRDCIFRFYGATEALSIKSAGLYQNCDFSGEPYVIMDDFNMVNNPKATFFNCRAKSGFLGVDRLVESIRFANLSRNSFAYGKYDMMINPESFHIGDGQAEIVEFESESIVTHIAGDTIILAPDSNREFTFSSANTNIYELDHLIVIMLNGESVPLGYVKAINNTTNEVTVQYINMSIPNGSHVLLCVYPIYTLGGFLGDIIASTPQITNIRMDWGSSSPSDLVGRVLKFPYGALGNYSPYIKITAYDIGTNTLSLLTQGPYYTGSFYFSNSVRKRINSPTLNTNVFSSNKILPERSILIDQKDSDVQTKYEVITSGWIDATSALDTRQAMWRLIGLPISGTGTNNKIARFNLESHITDSQITDDGTSVTVASLTGTGLRMVTANATGALSTKIVSQNNTLNTDGSIIILAEELITYIVVIPSNNLTGFSIGTTLGGGEIEPGTNLTAGTAYTWAPAMYFQSGGDLYFSNVLTDTKIIIKKA